MTETEQLQVTGEPASSVTAPAAMPDYILEPNAVLMDQCRWRHGQVSLLQRPTEVSFCPVL